MFDWWWQCLELADHLFTEFASKLCRCRVHIQVHISFKNWGRFENFKATRNVKWFIFDLAINLTLKTTPSIFPYLLPKVRCTNNTGELSWSIFSERLLLSKRTRWRILLFNKQLKSLDYAKQFCFDNGELVKINSARENEFVLTLVRKTLRMDQVRIGLQWIHDRFYWSDSSIPIFTYWVPGEPNGKAAEPCSFMWTGSQRFSPTGQQATGMMSLAIWISSD